ncbi:MAG: ribonuclease HI [Rickettsiaceae bacterium]|nr:ribonuclease HI [Rickettsiaceae bacterium]
MTSPKITIYTDGACSGNPGYGGWAVYYLYDNIGKLCHGNEKLTTNNRMELIAVIKALAGLKKHSNVVVYTDSTYVKEGITKWIQSWMANNWRTSSKKEVKNIDLWQELLVLEKKHVVQWHWIRAHTESKDANSIGNSIVDDLSVQSRKLVCK